MSIDDYIIKLESVINSFTIVASYNLSMDRKISDIAFISGKIEFRNGSILDFKEFVESTEDRTEKYKYAYNYRISSNNIFRYDNAPDPAAKGIKTFPQHKHLGNGTIVESPMRELRDVLEEIERIYITETFNS
ncbi:MAG: hypothetical protein HY754_13185 [Nitrospirae bacterium]|nr:hypothetical protein [Nitrospirota bacterium]